MLKIKRIIKVLLAYPEGIWLRRLAKEASVPTTTAHRYIEGFFGPFVENVGAKNEKGHFFGVRIVRLKPGVRKRLEEGVQPEQLLQAASVWAERDE